MAKGYTIHKLETPGEKLMTAQELYNNLRLMDKRELADASMHRWKEVFASIDKDHPPEDPIYTEIRESIEMSDECWIGVDRRNRDLIAVWGIREVEGRRGRLIWCLGTYLMDKYWMSFASESRKIIKRWAGRYGVLYNAVGAFNKDSIRWLEWCGAKFDEQVPIGIEYFLPFRIEGGKKNV